MSRDHARNTDDMNLEESLQRLGVRDLQERLELSSLLAGTDLVDSDRCTCSCTCDDMPDDLRYAEHPMPDHSGFGTVVGPW